MDVKVTKQSLLEQAQKAVNIDRLNKLIGEITDEFNVTKRAATIKCLIDYNLVTFNDVGGVIYNGKLLKGYTDSDGYYSVFIMGTSIPIHKFISYIKFGDIAITRGIVTRHLNDNNADNSWDNIGIGTVKDNWYDMPVTKRKQIMAKVNSKLTREWRVNQSLMREAAKSPEIKSAEAKRGWITRRKNMMEGAI